jgi:hypothetical protein
MRNKTGLWCSYEHCNTATTLSAYNWISPLLSSSLYPHIISLFPLPLFFVLSLIHPFHIIPLMFPLQFLIFNVLNSLPFLSHFSLFHFFPSSSTSYSLPPNFIFFLFYGLTYLFFYVIITNIHFVYLFFIWWRNQSLEQNGVGYRWPLNSEVERRRKSHSCLDMNCSPYIWLERSRNEQRTLHSILLVTQPRFETILSHKKLEQFQLDIFSSTLCWAVMLVLVMKWICQVRRWDGLSYRDTHITFIDYLFEHSHSITVIA